LHSVKDNAVIHHVISSGFASTPNPKVLLASYAKIFKKKFYFPDGYSMRMDRLANGKMFIREENFMCLVPTPRMNSVQNYNAVWFSRPNTNGKPILDSIPPPTITNQPLY